MTSSTSSSHAAIASSNKKTEDSGDGARATVELAAGSGHVPATVNLAAGSAISGETISAGPPADARRRVSEQTHNIDQARKMRVTIGFITACCVAATLGLRVVKGDDVARLVFQIGLGFGAVSGLWALVRLRDLSNYSTRMAFFLGHVGAVAATSAYYYWGVFSAAIVIVPAAALLIAHADKRWRNISLAVHFMGGHATLALLQIFGVVADRGYTPIDPIGDKPIATQLVRLALLQFIMLGGFIVANKMRMSSLKALSDLDDALREISARDALLAEAELARAEVLALDVPGRYSEQTIGKYKLGLIIGRGGLGVVYDAVNVETGEPAAIKVLHPHILARPDQFRRFTRELKIAAELSAPNVVTVFDIPQDEDSFPYLAMERLYGENLADYLLRGPLPADELCSMLAQVGAGLDHAHQAGVVHRDVKPRNLFRLADEKDGVRWKILDFGTCREVDQGATVTEMGTVLGTPGYMAPEQARGNRVDARADIYSLAVVAYRALTGRPAYAARELPRLLQDVAYAMPPRPTSLFEAPRDLDLVLAIGLAKRPYERFETASELAVAVEQALTGQLSDELRERGATLEARRGWGPS